MSEPTKQKMEKLLQNSGPVSIIGILIILLTSGNPLDKLTKTLEGIAEGMQQSSKNVELILTRQELLIKENHRLLIKIEEGR